jgi:crotonobetainyl-CoA:carnitine CoA-transferase CaiB-like acyl-CoA transferase
MKPLEGVTVVDLTHALAGPVCAYQLMLLGADVIKIENPGQGDDFRAFARSAFDAVNAGKRSVCLNLKHPRSLEVLERLVRRADVLVDNFKPGTAEKLGVTWEIVREWNPRLIWCSISGFGLEGPWRDKPAVEWSVQAASGLSESYIADDADPRDVGLGVLDISTGHAAAASIMAALLLRDKTGEGQRVDVAMIDVALNLSLSRIGATGPTRRERRPAVGRFMAKDRRVFIMGAHQRWFETISRVIGEPSLVDDPRFADPASRQANAEALREAIEARLAERTADEWETLFTAAGMPAATVRRTGEAAASAHVQQRGLVHQAMVSDRGETLSVLGPPYQIAGVEFAPSGPVPSLGDQTEAVLADLGYSPQDVDGLRAAAVV